MVKIELILEDGQFEIIKNISKEKGIQPEKILQELFEGAIESYLEDLPLP